MTVRSPSSKALEQVVVEDDLAAAVDDIFTGGETLC